MSTGEPLSILPEKPLLSVIIPSYNQGTYIRKTIESCLEQDYRPIEIVVIDGASTDNTADVLKSFGDLPELRWVSEPDAGVADAVNKGMSRAKGSICAIQSSDDAYLPGAFAQAVQGFRRRPQAALIYADTIKTDALGNEVSRFTTGPFSITNFLSKRTVVLQPAAFFRKEAFMAVGGWSPAFFNADTECWLRIILRYEAFKENTFWALRRMHAGQRDGQRDRILESYRRMMLENPAIQSGPRRWRRAARCGVLRHVGRYSGTLTRAEMRRIFLRAAWLWPPVLLDPEIGAALVPFYLPIRNLVAACRGQNPDAAK